MQLESYRFVFLLIWCEGAVTLSLCFSMNSWVQSGPNKRPMPRESLWERPFSGEGSDQSTSPGITLVPNPEGSRTIRLALAKSSNVPSFKGFSAWFRPDSSRLSPALTMLLFRQASMKRPLVPVDTNHAPPTSEQ
jgi:hypothetical protein